MSQPTVKNETTPSGVTVTLRELIDLRLSALNSSTIERKLILPGQKLTPIRGHGIEFDGTRAYQPGDDIRSMAWRVTARSLKPHIKVYQEEKERPVWLALDLSPSLYFGTRCMFKSVKSIIQAALIGWSALLKRERIGAIITGDQKSLIFQPQAGEKSYLTILNSLVEFSRLRPSFNEMTHLHPLLKSLQQYVCSRNLIYIFSDFLQFDRETEKLILYLAQKAQVILNFVYDPFEASPPPPYQYVLTNGQQKMLFNMKNEKNRENYRQQFQMKIQAIKDFARKHQMILRMHCTDVKHEIEV